MHLYNLVKKALKKCLVLLMHIKCFFYYIVVLCKYWIRPYSGPEPWLVGENYGHCLKDNGYCFYSGTRMQKPVFFVIGKHALQDYPELQTDSRVLLYGSFRHIEILYQCKAIFFSHSPRDILYPYLHYFLLRKKCGVFLRHGVYALKKMNANQLNFLRYVDVFIASSQWEKKIICAHTDYPENQVFVTGQARYDYLLAAVKESKYGSRKKLLYMPTWRSWIKDHEIKPVYTASILQLLQSTKLKSLLEEADASLTVYFHVFMRQHIDYLYKQTYSDRIHLARSGESTVQQLLLDNDILITDYSSVCWDFNYIGKPVVFYQFDQQQYLDNRGSYIDLDTIPIGPVCKSQQILLDCLQSLMSDSSDILPEKPRDIVHDFHDADNIKRIVNTVERQLAS